MKTTLTAIALSALLACNVATAQVSITQQGSGNGAYTEQQGTRYPGSLTAATTIQIGNNNHAGDPVSHTPGILQRERFEAANARIFQQGDQNTANIVQDGAAFTVNAIIEQRGAGNTASLMQTIQTWSDGTIYQEGTNNLARIEQRFVADSRFGAVQNGSDNKLSVLQDDATHNGPSVTQTGSGNSATVELEHVLGSAALIEQLGSMNIADSVVRTGEGNSNAIYQDGTGNVAMIQQIGSRVFGAAMAEIRQTGANNFASLLQDGPNGASIGQLGNDNFGTVVQTYVGPGDPNTAFIRQYGNGFSANIVQGGAGNSAGVYQH
ncbi:hypothetical protein Q4S45_09945 [Massilia sp. R2A-15]|uniref:hypothetical protein n=1 Tax=Massilia sp. R2A-15 TaxID=3064278 RepID=UPI002733B967|nr:hypothetical protein [Massilia sp. R2A-15]WLI91418.1 hypothetical protein Q4S45_09945 [Massilia sp. R2A-15]